MRVGVLLGRERPLEKRFLHKAIGCAATWLDSDVDLRWKNGGYKRVGGQVVVVDKVVCEYRILAHSCRVCQAGEGRLACSIRNQNRSDRFLTVYTSPLRAAKNKELVPEDRTTHSEAHGVAIEAGLRGVRSTNSSVLGVQTGSSIAVIYRAVEYV